MSFPGQAGTEPGVRGELWPPSNLIFFSSYLLLRFYVLTIRNWIIIPKVMSQRHPVLSMKSRNLLLIE
jgi:hypothetical protein